jgi:molybdopterin molybdotransferase
MTGFLTLQSVDSVLDRLRDFPPLPEETLSVEEASGRVLAGPFSSPEDLPPFARSSMDGFAVKARDVFGASESFPVLLDCVGECPMGRKTEIGLKSGQTARIWTGGMLPQGADAVVMLEYARWAGEAQVELTRPVAPFDNVIAVGEDVPKGRAVLPAGRLLRPQELGLLAALGVRSARVRRKARVAVLSSGDEIVPIDAVPAPGQVRDINAYTLAALVGGAGAQTGFFGIIKDNEAHLRTALLRALDWGDIVLISGGSSAGQRDLTVDVFRGLPDVEILAHGVAISPGKPLILARRGNQSLWGLPGHAAGALVCAEVFLRPLLRRLSGRKEAEAWEGKTRVVLGRPIASTQGRRDYIRVTLTPAKDNALPTAMPVTGKSGLVSTLTDADALVVCPENSEGLYAGQNVEAHLLTV